MSKWRRALRTKTGLAKIDFSYKGGKVDLTLFVVGVVCLSIALISALVDAQRPSGVKSAHGPDIEWQWKTNHVDPMNMGFKHDQSQDSMIVKDGDTIWSGPWITIHDWVYSEELRDFAWATWSDRVPLRRERICRVCFRHEYQRQVEVKPPERMTAFDSLRAKLAAGIPGIPIPSPGMDWLLPDGP